MITWFNVNSASWGGHKADGVSKGEKRQLSPLVEHGDSNPVFDITWFGAGGGGDSTPHRVVRAEFWVVPIDLHPRLSSHNKRNQMSFLSRLPPYCAGDLNGLGTICAQSGPAWNPLLILLINDVKLKAPRADIIQIFFSVHIKKVGRTPLLDEPRGLPYGTPGPYRTVHATRDSYARTCHEILWLASSHLWRVS